MANMSSEAVFSYVGWTMYPLISIVAVMGNGLVLYAAFGKNNSMKFSVLRDLDIVIKSLAVTDLLIGSVGFWARRFASWMKGELDLDEDNNIGIKCRI